MESPILKVENFDAFFGANQILKSINMTVPKNKVVAMMGPSGCGKTTFIRCINRMHELNPDARAEGAIYLHEENVYEMLPIILRKRIGMVFQRPNPFPTMSIYENVIAGYILSGT